MLNKLIKSRKKMRCISFSIALSLCAVIMLAVPTVTIAAEQLPVELGTAANFAVLAGSGITNTGLTIINGNSAGVGGNIGTYPTTAITGFPPGVIFDGAIHTDSVAEIAQNDLTMAYNDAAGRTVDLQTISAALGGGQILYPGTYKSESSIQINGDLTLDAMGDPNAVFVFQAGSTLTTASASKIILTGGAQSSQIFWQAGSSVTLGSGSSFIGHILALTSITANTGATVLGQLLARNGAVTLDNNTITNEISVPIITLGAINTLPTNQDITVTATTNKGTLNAESHIFTANGSFDFVATDSAGNVATQTVIISNIDKIAPEITLGAINTLPTNQDITVTATTNEGTLNAESHVFTANGSFDFVATDSAGNVATQTVIISNIDKIAPEITLGSINTVPTNQDITVTATTNKGTLNAESHVFTANGSFDFVATDSAGNVSTKTVTISNIDKIAPETATHGTPWVNAILLFVSIVTGVLIRRSHTRNTNNQ